MLPELPCSGRQQRFNASRNTVGLTSNISGDERVLLLLLPPVTGMGANRRVAVSHLGLFMGRAVLAETWPAIVRWLAEPLPARRQAGPRHPPGRAAGRAPAISPSPQPSDVSTWEMNV